MMRRNGERRVGFTLIELLVVISIIAVLMSLLIAGVMRVRVVRLRAETSARLGAINNGIGTYKSSQSFGQVKYIPPGRLENGTWQPFRLRNSYPAGGAQPDANSFEAQYLQQVFGGGSGLNLDNLGYPGLSADLDANQTLTFFLGGIPESDGQGNVVFTGFSAHPQQPFTKRLTSDETRRGPILDLGGSKKYAVDASGFARLIDGYGNPYAYFSAYNGMQNKYYGGYGNDKFTNVNNLPMGAVVAYGSGSGSSRQYENASGFQIISAGEDGLFGTAGNWKDVGPTGRDDQANFSGSSLGAGPQ